MIIVNVFVDREVGSIGPPGPPGHTGPPSTPGILFYINGAEVSGVFSSQDTPPTEGSGICGRFDGSRALKVGICENFM